nr:MAG TPA: hypothetical protein [Caudoviricetes sp.]
MHFIGGNEPGVWLPVVGGDEVNWRIRPALVIVSHGLLRRLFCWLLYRLKQEVINAVLAEVAPFAVIHCQSDIAIDDLRLAAGHEPRKRLFGFFGDCDSVNGSHFVLHVSQLLPCFSEVLSHLRLTRQQDVITILAGLHRSLSKPLSEELL